MLRTQCELMRSRFGQSILSRCTIHLLAQEATERGAGGNNYGLIIP
jgi:hypothetical protein